MPMDFNYDELDKVGFKYSPKCQICAAKHPKTGVLIRDEIDKLFYETGGSYLDVLRHYNSIGHNFTLSLIRNHVNKHAPYLLNVGKTRKVMELAKQSIEERVDAEKALDRIISMGDALVESGDMPITEKLYLGALNLKSKQAQNTSMQKFITDVFSKAYQKRNELENPEVLDKGTINIHDIKDAELVEPEQKTEIAEDDEIISSD